MDSSDIKRNSKEFNFTESIAEITTNPKFKSGYVDLIHDKHTPETYIWEALSGIGDEIGETIYENVLNYVDNVANINTCKIKALKSIAKIVGIENFNVLEDLRIFPIDVLNALDIFSINPSYLVDRKFASSSLVQSIVKSSYDIESFLTKDANLSDLIDIISNPEDTQYQDDIDFIPELNREKYRNFVIKAFHDVLSSNILKQYSDGQYIFNNFTEDELLNGDSIESKILESNTLFQTSDYSSKTIQKEIDAIKKEYEIPVSFDEEAILKRIDSGTDDLEKYSGGQRLILDKMLELRKKQKFIRTDYTDSEVSKIGTYDTGISSIVTRNAYYSEETFKEYYDFLQIFYAKTVLDKSEINLLQPYSLNKTYTQLNSDKKLYSEFSLSANSQLFNELTETLKIDDNGNTVFVDGQLNMLSVCAENLADIALMIAEMRETLKLQAQKNYMRGTKMLTEYVVSEYLRNNLSQKYPKLKEYINGKDLDSRLKALVIEYDDCTDYYNLSTETTPNAKDFSEIKPRFWDNLDKVNRNTNGEPLERADISAFYDESLATNFGERTKDFLCAVYEIGAQPSYFEKDDNGVLHLKTELDGVEKDKALSSEYEALSSNEYEMFLSYHGSKVSYFPWYTYKNKTHPSFQSHPFLYNFVEHVQNGFAIENAFYGNASEELIRKLMSPQISTYLTNVGALSNMWQIEGSIYDFSGYDTRYEYATHTAKTKTGRLSPVTDYDGTFYPPAIEEYRAAALNDDEFERLIDNVRNKKSRDGEKNEETFYGRYYSHLDLTDDEADFIASQLSVFKQDILDLTDTQSDSRNIYDIYKYGLDKYRNSYILYKKYANGFDATQEEKRNTCGSLWFKLNHHPIGFPAFSYTDADVHHTETDEEGKIFDKETDRYKYSPINICTKPHIVGLDGYTTKDKTKEKASVLKANTTLLYDLCRISKTEYVPSILDIEFAGYTEYLLIAIAKNPGTESKYEDAIIYTNKVSEATNIRKIDRTVVSFLKYEYLTDNYVKILPDGDFKGFFAEKQKTYIAAIKNLSEENEIKKINLSYIDFPPSSVLMNQNRKKYVIDLDNVKNSEDASRTTIIGLWSKLFADDFKQIQVAFAENTFTLVFPSYYDPTDAKFPIRTFIGHNETDYDLNPIEDEAKGGRSDYISSAVDVPHEYNSIDKFTGFLTVLDVPLNLFTTLVEENVPKYKNYGLIADSSWIPFYVGLDGYIKTWPITEYEDSKHLDFELLGYSYNKFAELVRNRMLQIGIDEHGNLRESSLASLLSAGFRVYEDFKVSDFVDYRQNEAIKRPLQSADGEYYFKWKVNLLSSVTEDTLDQYHIMLFNLKSGNTNAIINCFLSDLDGEGSDEFITYDENETKTQQEILDGNGGRSRLKVVGTPNVFAGEFGDNESFSNHIINIKGVKCIFGREENGDGTYRYTIELRFYQNKHEPRYDKFYLLAKTLVLFVYRDSLGEYSLYHYLDPFAKFPFNAAMNDIPNNTRINWPTLEEQRDNVRLHEKEYYESSLPLSNYFDEYKYKENGEEKTGDKEYIGNYTFNLSSSSTSESVKNDPIKTYPQPQSDIRIPKDGIKPTNYVGYRKDFDPMYVKIVREDHLIPKSDPEKIIKTYRRDPDLRGNYGVGNEHSVSHRRMSEINLEDYSHLSSILELNNGEITFKMSEEDKYDFLLDNWPPRLVDALLYTLFNINVDKTANNIFNLSSTYIVQLENPKIISELISSVAVPLFSVSEECIMAYEDYIDAQYFIDTEGIDVIDYIKHFDENAKIADEETIEEGIDYPAVSVDWRINRHGTHTGTWIPSEDEDAPYEKERKSSERRKYTEISTKSKIKYIYPGTEDAEVPITVTSELSDYNTGDEPRPDAVWDKLQRENAISPHNMDVVDRKVITDMLFFTVTPEEIDDYLKLYATYGLYDAVEENGETHQEIELFFNMQNLFYPMYKHSPDKIHWVPEFKPTTWLQLKSHESGLLNIIFQLHYIDGTGNILGLRDLHVATYKITNLSDDKPKFLISRIWRLDNRDGHLNKIDGESKAFLVVETKRYPIEVLSTYIDSNFTLEEDFPASTKLNIFSDIPLSTVTGTLYTETGTSYSKDGNTNTFIFEDEFSNPGEYNSDTNGFTDFSYKMENKKMIGSANLEYTFKEGSIVPDDEPEIEFPIDIISADAYDIYGNKAETIVIPGSIIFDLGEDIIFSGKYLARESNLTNIDNPLIKTTEPLGRLRRGWVLEENKSALIRMYGNENQEPSSDDLPLLAKIPESTAEDLTLKTETNRNTRRTVRNNVDILYEISTEESGGNNG